MIIGLAVSTFTVFQESYEVINTELQKQLHLNEHPGEPVYS